MISAVIRQSIRYPGVVVALALTLIIYGLYVLSRANLDVFPEFSPSQVVIQTEAPGLSAELVELQVTTPIENALAGGSGVEIIRSQSIPGLSVVHVFFKEGSSVYQNRQVVGERLIALANQLPKGVAQPTMTPLTSSASTVLGVGLTSDQRSLMDLRSLVDWTIRPHLLAVVIAPLHQSFGRNFGPPQILSSDRITVQGAWRKFVFCIVSSMALQ